MRKITILAILMFAMSSVWAQLPNNWTGDTDIETFQESTNVHSGSYSCGVIVNSDVQGNCDLANDVVISVAAGDSYKINLWGYTSAGVRGRAVFLWEGTNSTYSNEYVGPETGGWVEFISEGIVPDGATGVRVGIRFYDVSVFTPGEIQYIDDVMFESPTGNALTVTNGDFETWPGINAEPSEYPTNFTAQAQGLNAVLAWADAIGDQLPDAYLIKASTQNDITAPIDGMYEADDLDFSDGMATANVNYGVGSFSFTGLAASSTYYFKIYSYSNAGANIDFKNDGTAPETMVEISSVTIIESQNFDVSWGEWTQVSVAGDEVWDRDNTYGVNGTACAKITGYNAGTTFANEDWLISPSLDLTQYEDELLSFYTSVGYIQPDEFAAKVSNDYDGNGDPTSASWTDLNPILPDGSANWVWTNSGDIDLTPYDGDNVHIAFIYTCGTDAAATWEVDDILITGEGEVVVTPEPTNYPTSFAALAEATTINLSWMDAIGETIPAGYLVLASDQDNITMPVDGTPVANDVDFSDGMGALNILPGMQMASFSGLTAEMTYYFKVFPFTNSGNVIDYKTDGTAPVAEATTSESSEVDIIFTTFDQDWESWTSFSVVGDQVWDRDNTYGIESTPCAKMSGYAGEAFDNEDWLISPSIDLSNTSNENFEFYSASAYTGPALEVFISTDYDGTGIPTDFTWIDLSAQVLWPADTSFFDWTLSGVLDISAYTDEAIYIAFKFTSTAAGSATWEIDNVRVAGQGEVVVTPEPTNYPSDYTAWAESQTIFMSWTDAIGDVIPEGYLVLFSNQEEFTGPIDGTPVSDDLDLSDGNGAINIMPGEGVCGFTQLMESTMYYSIIFPYTNSGADINYKTDGIPPSASATTEEVTASDVLFTTFNDSWENWTQVSVVGDQVWDRDNTYGIESTPCAKMSGYAGEAFDNEDWLISPSIDLSNTSNETFEFYSASAYTGPALEVFVSTDYDGTGIPTDFTWIDFSDQTQWPSDTSFFDWTLSGALDISAYTDEAIYIAFKFTSTANGSATWEIDNVKVMGESSGIAEDVPQVNLDLYPNPTTGILYFNADKPVTGLEVYNVNGMLVYREANTATQGQIDLSQLSKGVYVLKINADNKYTLSRRIIIQ